MGVVVAQHALYGLMQGRAVFEIGPCHYGYVVEIAIDDGPHLIFQDEVERAQLGQFDAQGVFQTPQGETYAIEPLRRHRARQ